MDSKMDVVIKQELLNVDNEDFVDFPVKEEILDEFETHTSIQFPDSESIVEVKKEPIHPVSSCNFSIGPDESVDTTSKEKVIGLIERSSRLETVKCAKLLTGEKPVVLGYKREDDALCETTKGTECSPLEKAWFCMYCDKNFLGKDALIYHSKLYHEVCACKACANSYIRLRTLARQMPSLNSTPLDENCCGFPGETPLICAERQSLCINKVGTVKKELPESEPNEETCSDLEIGEETPLICVGSQRPCVYKTDKVEEDLLKSEPQEATFTDSFEIGEETFSDSVIKEFFEANGELVSEEKSCEPIPDAFTKRIDEIKLEPCNGERITLVCESYELAETLPGKKIITEPRKKRIIVVPEPEPDEKHCFGGLWDDEKPLICRMCHATFVSKVDSVEEDLNDENVTRPVIESSEKSPGKDADRRKRRRKSPLMAQTADDSFSVMGNRFYCTFCRVSFNCHWDLCTHLAVTKHVRLKCFLCSRVYDIGERVLKGCKLLQCQDCSNYFMSEHNLRKHTEGKANTTRVVMSEAVRKPAEEDKKLAEEGKGTHRCKTQMKAPLILRPKPKPVGLKKQVSVSMKKSTSEFFSNRPARGRKFLLIPIDQDGQSSLPVEASSSQDFSNQIWETSTGMMFQETPSDVEFEGSTDASKRKPAKKSGRLKKGLLDSIISSTDLKRTRYSQLEVMRHAKAYDELGLGHSGMTDSAKARAYRCFFTNRSNRYFSVFSKLLDKGKKR